MHVLNFGTNEPQSILIQRMIAMPTQRNAMFTNDLLILIKTKGSSNLKSANLLILLLHFLFPIHLHSRPFPPRMSSLPSSPPSSREPLEPPPVPEFFS